MNEILDAIVTASIPVILALITYAAALATKFINAKREEITTKTKNDKIKLYTNLVSENAINVVQTLNSTLVDELKKANADGKLTEEEILEIRDLAAKMLMTTLTDDAKEILTQVFGDLDEYLTMLIESTVYKVKNKLN